MPNARIIIFMLLFLVGASAQVLECGSQALGQSHAESDCTAQTHICACCVSGYFATDPVQNQGLVLPQGFRVISAFFQDTMSPRTWGGKIFRPPIC